MTEGFYYCCLLHNGERLELKTPRGLAEHIVKTHPLLAERIIADTAKMFKFQQQLTDEWFEWEP